MKLRINKRDIKAELCYGIKAVLGFMFSVDFLVNKAKVLVFPKEQKISLHMFFVFFPLLVLFVSNKRIVEIKVLKPFTFYASKNKAKYAIEIPLKLVKQRFAVGDKIKFIS